MDIKLNSIKWKNFLSYGDEYAEYSFSNGIDLINAKNGNGKSTFADAVFYAFFGKPFRKIKTSSLINRYTKKKLTTVLEFDVDGVGYKIIRGMKPNIFEIYQNVNGEMTIIEEMATTKDYQRFLESDIIQMDDTIFRQLVSQGANNQNSKPFMELSSLEKENLFQVLTDTSIFGHIKEVLKLRKSDKQIVLKENTYKQDILAGSIQSEKLMISQMEKQNEDFLTNHKKNIEITKQSIAIYNDNILKYTDALLKLKKLKEKYDVLSDELATTKNEKYALQSEKTKIESELIHINKAEEGAISCTKCSTINYLVDVDVSKKDAFILRKSELEADISNYTLEEGIKQEEVNKIKEKLLNGKRVRDLLEADKTNLIYSENKLTELMNINEVKIDYTAFEEKTIEAREIEEYLISLRSDIDNINTLENLVGGNGIKQEVIKTQIPFVNKHINHFLELFSLVDYKFIIDENFKERILSREDESEFNQLSNGQKSRISFSIMFAFLKLIEERSSVRINLLLLDEVLDSSVDALGREELLDILKSEFSLTKNIIIISHNEEVKNRLEVFNRLVHVNIDKFSSLEIEEI